MYFFVPIAILLVISLLATLSFILSIIDKTHNYIVMYEFHLALVVFLHISLCLGLTNEWIQLLGIEVWIIWFLVHAIVYSLYILYTEFFSEITLFLRKNLLYHSFFLVLWYYQHVYVLTNQSVQNYEVGCKRDLLILTTTTTFTILLLAFGATFGVLIS